MYSVHRSLWLAACLFSTRMARLRRRKIRRRQIRRRQFRRSRQRIKEDPRLHFLLRPALPSSCWQSRRPDLSAGRAHSRVSHARSHSPPAHRPEPCAHISLHSHVAPASNAVDLTTQTKCNMPSSRADNDDNNLLNVFSKWSSFTVVKLWECEHRSQQEKS